MLAFERRGGPHRTKTSQLPSPDCVVVCKSIDGSAYRNSTGRLTMCRKPPDFRVGKRRRADYHQQYLAKNPNGYCGIGGWRVPFKVAELQVGEKA